jgi:hypothetical protein
MALITYLMGTLPNSSPSGVWASAEAFKAAGVALLAEDSAQHVDSHCGASLLDVAHGEIAPEVGDDIEDHGGLGSLSRLDQSCTVLELLIDAEDDDSQQVFDPGLEGMGSLVPAGR